MTKPRVLQIGMDPEVIDFSLWPGQDARMLWVRINAAQAALRGAGIDVVTCLLPDDADAAESIVAGFFADARFDVVEIGSGLRASHEFTPVFERVVNTVTAQQPGVRFCFNDSPETTLDAVRRGLRAGGTRT